MTSVSDDPRWAWLTLTDRGLVRCRHLRDRVGPGHILTLRKRDDGTADRVYDAFGDMMAQAFTDYDVLVCVMATGIVVRALASQMRSKQTDPAVLVMDEAGRYCISLLSGHLGGANDAARTVECLTGARAVITTASDVLGRPAADILARELGCGIANMQAAKEITALMVNDRPVVLVNDAGLPLPPLPLPVGALDRAGEYQGAVILSDAAEITCDRPFVQLVPRFIVAGVGCRRGVPAERIQKALADQLEQNDLHPRSLAALSTVDIKAREPGLQEAARYLNVPLIIIERQDIAAVEDRFEGSEFVKKTLGVACVAEPCGYIASRHGRRITGKTPMGGITLSLWRMSHE